jgi:hypothetical protein
MPSARKKQEMDWKPVTGRALAFLCLHYADMRSKTLVEQADFLARFGIPRAEAATILGTTEESLRVMSRKRTGRKRSGRPKSTDRNSRGRKR